MASNQMNIHRKKSIVVNKLFEELYGELGRRSMPEAKNLKANPSEAERKAQAERERRQK